MQVPNHFNLFNIPIGALGLTLAGGQSIQDAINQLIASGASTRAALPRWPGCSVSARGMPLPSSAKPCNVWVWGHVFGVHWARWRTTFARRKHAASLEHVTLRAAQGKTPP